MIHIIHTIRVETAVPPLAARFYQERRGVTMTIIHAILYTRMVVSSLSEYYSFLPPSCRH